MKDHNVENTTEIDQSAIADIMNRINETLDDIGYIAVGYDNSDGFLKVLIDAI